MVTYELNETPGMVQHASFAVIGLGLRTRHYVNSDTKVCLFS